MTGTFVRYIPAGYPAKKLLPELVFRGRLLRNPIAGVSVESMAIGFSYNAGKVWVLGVKRDGKMLVLNVCIGQNEYFAEETCDYLIWRIAKFAVEGE